MSVPVNERTHGKFEAVTKAFELSVYTLKITKNEKIFTKDFQEALTDKIVSAALDMRAEEITPLGCKIKARDVAKGES